ncbi:unnamed protein product [Brassica rapa]|uniref:Uncharacterized protein n=2 Tax=Brassica TaxID=3705 RepID=A0A8D9CYS3_BRACM|nr:unnamed protein product [Brassica napus]CAG7865759.1 unnamed protein product [Brassica rapa]
MAKSVILLAHLKVGHCSRSSSDAGKLLPLSIISQKLLRFLISSVTLQMLSSEKRNELYKSSSFKTFIFRVFNHHHRDLIRERRYTLESDLQKLSTNSDFQP